MADLTTKLLQELDKAPNGHIPDSRKLSIDGKIVDPQQLIGVLKSLNSKEVSQANSQSTMD